MANKKGNNTPLIHQTLKMLHSIAHLPHHCYWNDV